MKVKEESMIRLFEYLAYTFIGLLLGGLFTGPGTSSEWYIHLDKAPWSPPGWVFGFAWTLVGITWSVWAANTCHKVHGYLERYSVVWLLNLVWSPLFFFYHNPVASFFVIFALLAFVIESFLRTYKDFGIRMSLWVLPYVAWITLATSLNLYIILENY